MIVQPPQAQNDRKYVTMEKVDIPVLILITTMNGAQD